MMKKIFFKIWLRGICLRNHIEGMYDLYKLDRRIQKMLKELKREDYLM